MLCCAVAVLCLCCRCAVLYCAALLPVPAMCCPWCCAVCGAAACKMDQGTISIWSRLNKNKKDGARDHIDMVPASVNDSWHESQNH